MVASVTGVASVTDGPQGEEESKIKLRSLRVVHESDDDYQPTPMGPVAGADDASDADASDADTDACSAARTSSEGSNGESASSDAESATEEQQQHQRVHGKRKQAEGRATCSWFTFGDIEFTRRLDATKNSSKPAARVHRSTAVVAMRFGAIS